MAQLPCIGLSWHRILIHLLGVEPSTFTTGVIGMEYALALIDPPRTSWNQLRRKESPSHIGSPTCLREKVDGVFWKGIQIHISL